MNLQVSGNEFIFQLNGYLNVQGKLAQWSWFLSAQP